MPQTCKDCIHYEKGKRINFLLVKKGRCVRFPATIFVSREHYCHEFKQEIANENKIGDGCDDAPQED